MTTDPKTLKSGMHFARDIQLVVFQFRSKALGDVAIGEGTGRRHSKILLMQFAQTLGPAAGFLAVTQGASLLSVFSKRARLCSIKYITQFGPPI